MFFRKFVLGKHATHFILLTYPLSYKSSKVIRNYSMELSVYHVAGKEHKHIKYLVDIRSISQKTNRSGISLYICIYL